MMSSAGAASLGAPALGLGSSIAGATATEPGRPTVVRMHGDGLGLSPAEYAELLVQLASAGKIEEDYYSQGGSIELLERQMARELGKEQAIFLPTGTLANQLAVRRLVAGHGRVLVQAESHLYNDSGDCLPVLSQLQVTGLAEGAATFSLERVQAEVERAATSKVTTPIRAIAIESPVRRLWGQLFAFDEMQKISAFARRQGIGLHLDGARLFLAEPYTGVGPAAYAALFDTVYVSLWKYFNAASGAILAGPAALIDGLHHSRRMFGGSLPHGWLLAGVASHYLDGFRERFAAAVDRSEQLFRLLAEQPKLAIERQIGGSNVAKLKLSGVDHERFRDRLERSSIQLSKPLPDGAGFKIQVNETWLAQSPETVAEALVRAAS